LATLASCRVTNSCGVPVPFFESLCPASLAARPSAYANLFLMWADTCTVMAIVDAHKANTVVKAEHRKAKYLNWQTFI